MGNNLVAGTPVKYPPIPKGCRKYRFNCLGQSVTSEDPAPSADRVLDHKCVFECIASNERKAVEKYVTAMETMYEFSVAFIRNNPKRAI